MDMPFKLIFYKHTPVGENFTSFSTSWQSAIQNADKYTYSIQEAQDLRIRFYDFEDTNSKIYIELLDTLPEECFEEEENLIEEENSFFFSSDAIRPLYMNQNSKNNRKKLEYPYILPGRYKITIRRKKQVYYAFLRINPLRITTKQLDTMRDDIENTMRGLSKQLYTKNRQVALSKNHKNEVELINKYNILIHSYSTFLLNINEIANNPYYEIKKIYSLVPASKNAKIDLETIKFKQIRRDITKDIKAYHHEINYNVSINKSLKYILNDISKDIKQVIPFVEENCKNLENDKKERKKFRRQFKEIDLQIFENETNLKKLKQMRSSINAILAKDWMKNLKVMNNFNLIHLLKRPGYRLLYNVYKDLQKNKEISNNTMQNYLYYWKETPLLYEIWGFIKMLEAIFNSKYDFNEYNGWIFDQRKNHNIFPFLNSDTQIIFKNDKKLRLKIYYDSFVLKDRDQTSIENPLFTSYKNNRPDFRLDIYDKDLYKGSLMADFKYRPMSALGSEKIFKNHNDSQKNYPNGYKVYKQLKNYSNCETLYFNTESKSQFVEKKVLSVWALFPKLESEKNLSIVKDKESTVRRVSLSPRGGTEHIQEELEKLVDYCLQD